jgi:hypothetical protein
MKIRQRIYIRNIKHFTDIDTAVDFVFPVNKIDREKGDMTTVYPVISVV